jgi:hypothetical protein
MPTTPLSGSGDLYADPAGLKRQLFGEFKEVLQTSAGRVTEAIGANKIGGEGSGVDIDQTVAQLTPATAVVKLMDALSDVPMRHQLDVNTLGDLLQRVEDGNADIAEDVATRAHK